MICLKSRYKYDQYCQNISILIDDLNQLRDDINRLFGQKNSNREEKKKWDEMQAKLLNREYQNRNINTTENKN